MKRILLAGGVAILLTGVLAGCGGDKKASTQVVAKVNGQEITIHQVNHVLQRLGSISEAQAKEAGKQVLASLVEQEAVLQKALEQKVDRDPNVVQALDAARRQILVQAYLEKQAKSSTPSPDDISRYFDDHPELFEHRKMFRFNEIIALPRPEQVDAVRGEVARSGNDMTRVARWLKDQKIAFRAGPGERASEQVPTDLLPKLAQMKEGDIATVNMQSGLGILQFVAAREQPVTKDQAKPVIERFLVNQKRLELAQAEVKRIKGEAKVEYLGAFAEQAKDQQAAAKDTTAATDKTAAAKTTAPTPAKPESDFMDKGLSGVK